MSVSLRPGGTGTYHVIWRVLSVDTHTTDGSFTLPGRPVGASDAGSGRASTRLDRHSRDTLRRDRDNGRRPDFQGGGGGALLCVRSSHRLPGAILMGADRSCRMARSCNHRGIRRGLGPVAGRGHERSCRSARPHASDILSTVLTETQFGTVSEFRFCTGDRSGRSVWLMTGFMAIRSRSPRPRPCCGHRMDRSCRLNCWRLGYLHLTADVLHLVAAAAWLGGLVPLALLLSQLGAWRSRGPSLASQGARRFSMLGIVSVGTISDRYCKRLDSGRLIQGA